MRKRIPTETVEKIRELWSLDWRIVDIAAHLGLKVSTTRAIAEGRWYARVGTNRPRPYHEHFPRPPTPKPQRKRRRWLGALSHLNDTEQD